MNESALEDKKLSGEAQQLNPSFYDIKEKASMNLSKLLDDLQAFDRAIREENISEIYRLYNSDLNKELKISSNRNHEIDRLLMCNIHEKFIQTFPFMELVDMITPTISYYKIGTYYHERPTIGIDASSPKIFILPNIDKEWTHYTQKSTSEFDQQLNQLEAKVITAKTEIEQIDEAFKELTINIKNLDNKKGFFNWKKVNEEIKELENQKQILTNKKLEWLPYIKDPEKINHQKEVLLKEAKEDQLRAAIVEKEQRQLKRYFGGKEKFNQVIHHFLLNYLESENRYGS